MQKYILSFQKMKKQIGSPCHLPHLIPYVESVQLPPPQAQNQNPPPPSKVSDFFSFIRALNLQQFPFLKPPLLLPYRSTTSLIGELNLKNRLSFPLLIVNKKSPYLILRCSFLRWHPRQVSIIIKCLNSSCPIVPKQKIGNPPPHLSFPRFTNPRKTGNREDHKYGVSLIFRLTRLV